jgi:hypothetical protein
VYITPPCINITIHPINISSTAKIDDQDRVIKELQDTIDRERKQCKQKEEEASLKYEQELVALDARVRKV